MAILISDVSRSFAESSPASGPDLTLEKIEQVTFSENVDLSLIIEDKYCRPVREWRVHRMAREWKPRGAGALYVSLRPDGRYAILDGNHRRRAAMLVGVKTLPARVFIDLTYEEEADLFDIFNQQARGNAMDRFRAKIQKKDSQALIIKQIAEYYGLEIDSARHDGDSRLFCIADVERIYEDYGADMLRQIFRILTQAWSGRRSALGRSAVVGVSMFLARHGDEPQFNEKRLIEKMRLIMPEEMIARSKSLQAAERSDGASAYGKSLVTLYNQNLRDTEKMLLKPWLPRIRRKGEALTGLEQAQRQNASHRAAEARKRKPEARGSMLTG